jgi:hypothetical protein
MSTKGVADIVFCLDASGSMSPCFKGVKDHIGAFVAGLGTSAQVKWDLRFDFVAYNYALSGNGPAFQCRSVEHRSLLPALYPQAKQGLFTADLERFRNALSSVVPDGDESSLVALDCALDFPWREASSCHRIVIMMTDECFETGQELCNERSRLSDLIRKIQDLRVMLFLVAPECEVYSKLSEVDRCEFTVLQGANTGLADVNFKEVLGYIGKSVSVSQLQAPKSIQVERGLFGQGRW